MKYITALLLIYAMLLNGAFAATSGSGLVSNVLGLGSSQNSQQAPIVIPVGATPVTLLAGAGSGGPTAGNYLSFSAQRGTGGQYHVPAGKTFYGTMYYMVAGNPSAAINAVLTLGTATAAFTNNGASVTGGVYYSSSSGSGDANLPIPDMSASTTPVSANVWQSFPFIISFSQNLYPFALVSGTTGRGYFIVISGYEI